MKYIIFFLLYFTTLSCGQQTKVSDIVEKRPLRVGAERLDHYLPLIKDKNIAGVFNQSSLVEEKHLVDVLLSQGASLRQIYTLEHGFRGEADAGEKVSSTVDARTGISLISLYGKDKKPSNESLKGIDVVIFDVQDVGVRFYTYISTLHYVMEACAENGVQLLVLDRPNPNGHCIDGPVLDSNYSSFIGMHQVPIVHGMTIGEYALMVKGEGWIKDAKQLDLKIIDCENYTHDDEYILPVKPSPNLPNNRSIYLYPSLCLFEGTSVSIGRGTDKQFQVIGHPSLVDMDFSFTPKPMKGANNPKHNGVTCYGEDLSEVPHEVLRNETCLDLEFIIKYYKAVKDQDASFFIRSKFFDKLAGNSSLRQAIEKGQSAAQIKANWEEGLQTFCEMRAGYLLYP